MHVDTGIVYTEDIFWQFIELRVILVNPRCVGLSDCLLMHVAAEGSYLIHAWLIIAI